MKKSDRYMVFSEKNGSRFKVFALFMAACLSFFSASAQTNPTDVQVMQELEKNLNAAEVLGWTSPDPCQWELISCSFSRVTGIQVGNKNLTGNLPKSLRNLTALTKLEFQNNQITGPLPSLNGMSNLENILLHDNGFTSIPADFFAGLTSLQAVYIDKNPFLPWKIPDSLQDARTLSNFSATSANVVGTIPDFFGTAFVSLTTLALSYNNLTGGLPSSFAGSSLKVLWANNQFGDRLSGSLQVLQNMTGLVEAWLNMNAFTGPLPDFSGLTYLKYLNLRDNQLTGTVPQSLILLPYLLNVSLTNNLLQGSFPAFPATMTTDVSGGNRFCLPKPGNCDSRVNVLLTVAKSMNYPAVLADGWNGNDPCNNWRFITCSQGNITVVNMQNLGLSGTISPAFAQLQSLQNLVLANNHLNGSIPQELTTLPLLRKLDVSNNSLSGKMPAFRENVIVSTEGNPNIGKDIGSSPPPTPAGNTPPRNSPTPTNGTIISGGENGNPSSISVGVVVGSVIAGVCGVLLLGLLGFFFYKRKQHPFGRVQSPNATVIHPRHSGSDPEMVKITVAGSSVAGGTASETYSRTSSGPSDVHVVETGNMVISIQVLRNVTNDFSEENVLGRGGFGTVYKGELHDGTKIAVKRMEAGVMSGKGLNEFQSEIAVLTKVRHRHLVALLGYCLDGNERILVYEYMPQGPLSHHLFDWKEKSLKPLEWMKRLSIALDVARGVEYLHSLAHQSFIHRDLKPSNILLGDDMRAKVADFGLVRLAPDGKYSIETRVAGTFGYLAPEYAVTGRVTTKVDVFSFGVILMELITGRRALDETQPEESQHLVTWFRRMQTNKDGFRKAIDPTVDLDPTEDTLASISKVAELAGHCTAREPFQRPDMGHTVNVLSSLVEQWKPTDPDAEDCYGIDLDMTLPQALKKWQAFEDNSQVDSTSASFVASMDNTQTSIPTRPYGFADSFTSADGR